MDQMAQDFADLAHFLFIYVREAQPDDYPAFSVHKTIEQKMEHACIMPEKHSTPRKIMVDLLDGDVHREFGGIPNMSWVIDHTGRVAYKAGWTVASEIRDALDDSVRIPFPHLL